MRPKSVGPVGIFLVLSCSISAPGRVMGAVPVNPYSNVVNEVPRWSPDGQRIAFMSNRDGNFEIYVMSIDGSNQSRLTNNIYNDQFPSWSPDGKQIVYSSTATASTFATPSQSAIFVMDSDGTNVRRLTNTSVGEGRAARLFNDSYPVWSPNGEKIAFLSDRARGWREIYLMNPDGSDVTQITFRGATHWNLAWTPDSKRLVFDGRMDGHPYANGSPQWGIYSINASGSRYTWGSGLQPFRNEQTTQAEFDAAFAPDGSKVAFNVVDRGKGQHSDWRGFRLAQYGWVNAAFTVAEGSVRVQAEAAAYSADWSPDGKRLVFVSDRDGTSELYLMDEQGGDVRRLTHSEDVKPASGE